MRAMKKILPLWLKTTVAVFLSEIGRWPIGIVFAHMLRSFAQSGGCGDKGKLRAEKTVQKITYKWLLKRYGGIVRDDTTENIVGNPAENTKVWVFWWQGEDKAPDLVKRCIASIRAKAGAHPVQLVDQWNYRQFVSIPDYIEEKRNNGMISLTHFSDYLRMALLAEHGGLWLDATIYVAGDLQPAFREPIFTIRNPGFDDTNISEWNWSGFALGCKKQFALPCIMLDLFNAYWKEQDYLIDYFLIDYMIRLAYDKCKLVRECIDNVPCSNSELYFYQENFEAPVGKREVPVNTWLFKLSWKKQYSTHTEAGLETVYWQWLRETEGMLCRM